ncbi:MAG: glycosyl hydrolase family 65 protein [Candidatus Omnitrophica bacterium]|nr:glycosyl hydrolase family 65 protein [Candidatus Omnitrophota bacterium]
MNTWKLIYDKFVPEEENLREALCTLGNGYFGTRGAAPETVATKVHYPGTYIAGVYNELVTDIAGRKVANEDFVNCPNWLMLNLRVGDGAWFDRLKVKILSWRVTLDMRKGVLSRRVRWQDEQGRITAMDNYRIVSMASPHCAALRCTITPENYSGKITIRSGIDGQIINAGVERYKQLSSKHLEAKSLGCFGRDGLFLQMQTNQSKIEITEATRTLVFRDNKRIYPNMRVLTHGHERAVKEFTIDVQKGKKYVVDKLMSLYTSRDQGIVDNCLAAQESVSKIESFDSLYRAHAARWRALWKKCDIEIEGDELSQLVLRLHAFHSLQVASTYNEEIDAGLPARGLHGEAYRGHIFWDELYVYPFYNLKAPEITRALLMYRYRRLFAAKEYARENGYKGAMYPWQSASGGNETTQTVHLNPMSGKWGPDYSCLQRHVSIAIAYNVWTYYYTSGDSDFLNRYGAEMILEISHFWSSISKFDEKKQRYYIENVMGPDEFHEKIPGSKKSGLKNNAYTNILVVWILEKALFLLDSMSEEDRHALLLKIEVTPEEVERWKDITTKMEIVIGKDGIIHQFEGYMDLKELDWDEYREKYDNIHRIDRILKAEGTSPDNYKVAKQADTLMTFYLLNDEEIRAIFKKLGYPVSKDMFRKNYDYYVQRTSHGSTLSRVVHAYLAQRIGYEDLAMEHFKDALKSDLYDTQGGTTQEGIHCGVMAGTIDLVMRCFAGLSVQDDQISLNPQLPKKWKRMKFSVRYRDIWFNIEITRKKVVVRPELLKKISLQRVSEVFIVVNNKKYKLTPGGKTVILLTKWLPIKF